MIAGFISGPWPHASGFEWESGRHDANDVAEWHPYWFSTWSDGADFHVMTVPMWFVTLLPIGGAIYFGVGRRATGPCLCRRCGYDLRATPARCPECGEPSPAVTPTHQKTAG